MSDIAQEAAAPVNGTTSGMNPKVIICPYCGETQPSAERCRGCGGVFEPLSLQATHNAMGPWFVHDQERSHHPGCSYETLAKLIERGQVTKYTIIRGPTSKQFWTIARHVPGVAHLLGYCHGCDGQVNPADHGCPSCGVPFGAYLDRNYLGLPEVRPLPWEAPEVTAASHTMPRSGETARAAAPAATGISSFAADDELLDAGASSATSGVAAGLSAGVAARPFEPDGSAMASAGAGNAPFGAVAAGADAGGDVLGSPVVRSMQRRLARQERTIRLLIAVVFAVAVIGAVINVLLAGRGPAGDDASPGPASLDVATIPGPAPRLDEPDIDASSGAGDAPEQAAPPVAPPPSETIDATPEIPAATGQDDQWQSIRTLAAGAEDESRAVDARLRDCEAALEIIGALDLQLTDEDERAILGAETTRLEEVAELLRLKLDFFGDGARDPG